MFGPVENEENRKLIDLDLREKLVLIAIVIPIVWIGIYPEPFLRRIEPSVIELIEHVERGGAAGSASLPSRVVRTDAEAFAGDLP